MEKKLHRVQTASYKKGIILYSLMSNGVKVEYLDMENFLNRW